LKSASNEVLNENYKISNLDFINFYTINNSCTLIDFESDARHEISNSKYILNKRDENVNKICKKACINSYTNFLNENRIEINENNDNEHSKGLLVGDSSNRKMEFTKLAAQRTHYKKLVKFIKLNDILLTRSNLQLSIDILYKIKEHLTFTDEKFAKLKEKTKVKKNLVKYPLFIIDIEFDIKNRKFKFTPSNEEFTSTIMNIIGEAHNEISKVNILSTHKNFIEYLRVKEDDGSKDNPDDGDIYNRIIVHPEYDILKSDIENIIHKSYNTMDIFVNNNLS